MIKKSINIADTPFNAVNVQRILADGSVSVELLNIDESGEVLESQVNVSFSKPWPFELTEEEIELLNPATDAPQL